MIQYWDDYRREGGQWLFQRRKLHRWYLVDAPARPLAVHLAEDVDEGWSVIMSHAFHAANAYAAWSGTEGTKGSSFNQMTSEDKVREGGCSA